MARREALGRLRALERWVDDAAAVHPRPQVFEGPFERDANDIRELARGDAALWARVGPRIAAARARLVPPSQGG